MRRLLVVGLVVIVLALGAVQPVAAACGSWGTVTNVSYYPRSAQVWVAVRLDNGTWAAFASWRGWQVGQRTYVRGCAGPDRYVEKARAW